VLFHEPLYCLHVQPVVHVGVPLESRSEQVLVAEAGFACELGELAVSVLESGQLSSLPREVAHVEGVVKGPEEYETVQDDSPFVCVPPHNWVRGLHHFSI